MYIDVGNVNIMGHTIDISQHVLFSCYAIPKQIYDADNPISGNISAPASNVSYM